MEFVSPKKVLKIGISRSQLSRGTLLKEAVNIFSNEVFYLSKSCDVFANAET
jgi:hypothetical protein